MNDIIFKQSDPGNFTAGRSSSIKFIVIHYTSNNGDTAQNNINYFASGKRSASAHYFVDEYDKIYQSVKDADTAWHCGGTKTYKHPSCRNSNSIGIEMCSRKNEAGYYFKPETVTNAVELTRHLMQKYNVPPENVIRHYDVWAKTCPAPFVNDPNQWASFKARLIEEEIDMQKLADLEQKLDQLTETVNKLAQQTLPRYGYIDQNMPEWARPTISKLVEKGFLKGDADGNLQLTENDLRMLVINDRAGLYN